MPMPRTPAKGGRRVPERKRPASTASKPRKANAAPPSPGEHREAACPQYVYGIIRAAQDVSLGPIGLGAVPAEVGTVCRNGLAAVVSEGLPGMADPTRDNLLAHERVNEALMREHTVLPMSFGTLLRSREDVAELLRAGHDAFEAALARVDGRLELGLKVFYMARDGEVVRARAERDAAALVAALGAVAVEARRTPPIGERMVLNAAFLVERGQVAAFDARVKSLAARHEELTFRSTGPWPPYHFVDIRLGLERVGV